MSKFKVLGSAKLKCELRLFVSLVVETDTFRNTNIKFS
nr:MAG TPA: hypothetical protein [Caudoviricetes sp.]